MIHTLTDLEMIFDTTFSCRHHIDNVTLEAYIVKVLYYSFVRSKLEYACLDWYPIYLGHIAELERIQKRFVNYIYLKVNRVSPESGFDYALLLNHFNLCTN